MKKRLQKINDVIQLYLGNNLVTCLYIASGLNSLDKNILELQRIMLTL